MQAQLSQFMDQINLLVNWLQKTTKLDGARWFVARTRQVPVRDARYTLWWDLCGETFQKVQNIGLVLNLGLYAQINGMDLSKHHT